MFTFRYLAIGVDRFEAHVDGYVVPREKPRC
jgi:hypothetical protein